MAEETSEPAWHQALAYAVTGQRLDELGRQRQPDVSRLAKDLERLAARSDVESTWSVVATDYRVPDELMEGIGAAQFWAVLADLRRALEVVDPGSAAAVTADRPLTREESRLLAERPPHHWTH